MNHNYRNLHHSILSKFLVFIVFVKYICRAKEDLRAPKYPFALNRNTVHGLFLSTGMIVLEVVI